MESLQPIINILTILTVLSVAVERVTDFIKLRHDASGRTDAEEPERRQRIVGVSLLTGILIALLVKADLMQIVARAGDPWATLGWVHWSEAQQAWVHDVAFKSWAGGVAVVLGCVLTGLSLGFGSRFWHDILEIVLDTSEAIKARVPRKARADASAAGGGSGEKS
jgi:hypothetical protein